MDFLLNDLHCHSTLSSCCSDPAMTPQGYLTTNRHPFTQTETGNGLLGPRNHWLLPSNQG